MGDPLITPACWGPGAWSLFHSIAFTFPKEPTEAERDAAISFFKSLRLLLPCSKCKREYGAFLENNPVEPHTLSSHALARWTVNAHNHVNLKMGKPEMAMQDVVNLYFGIQK